MFSRSHKRFTILIISILGLFISGWFEFFLFRKQYLSIYNTNRIVLFLLINLHVITILVLAYLIIKKSIKLFVESRRNVIGSNFRRNLLFSFTVFSVIPSFLVFFIAGKLITASINENFLLIQKEHNLNFKITNKKINSKKLDVSDYKQFKATRNPVYWSYLFTFILFTLIILFLSIWCAFYLAKRISEPIEELLKATEKIKKSAEHTNDITRYNNNVWNISINHNKPSDIKNLAISFNQMAKALELAQNKLKQNNKEMLMIIENIKEAVFYINKKARILSYNSASKKLVAKYLNITRFKNKRISFFGEKVTNKFIQLIKELLRKEKKQITKEISFSFDSEQKTLIVNITRVKNSFNKLKLSKEEGILVIIEDLSDIVKINKIKTWQEAVNQIAHEIKNPLTPIQLATQRLQRKYKNTLLKEKAFFDSTNTILNHVKIIKNLASHFSEFGQLPSNKIEPLDINKIINEVVCIYKVGYPEINFIYDFEKLMPFIKIDKKKMKRVVINLIDNSVRVLTEISEIQNIIPAYRTLRRKPKDKFIKIKTSYKSGLNQIELLISDNGPGIPKNVKSTLFMPHVSTNKKNMGLGLAIVYEIVAQNRGSIKLLENKYGASFQILLPT